MLLILFILYLFRRSTGSDAEKIKTFLSSSPCESRSTCFHIVESMAWTEDLFLYEMGSYSFRHNLSQGFVLQYSFKLGEIRHWDACTSGLRYIACLSIEMCSIQWTLHLGIARLEETFNHRVEPVVLLLGFRFVVLRIGVVLGNWVHHILTRGWCKGFSTDWSTASILKAGLPLTHCNCTTPHLLIRSSMTIGRRQGIHVFLWNALKTVLSRHDIAACEATHSMPSDNRRESVLSSIIVVPFLAWGWVSECRCHTALFTLTPWPLPLVILLLSDLLLWPIVVLSLIFLNHL